MNYSGKVYIVIDDEDKTSKKYYENFGDKVIMFSKKEVGKTFDEGDNFNDRRCIIYARNVCFELARERGIKYFMQFDDDYTNISFRNFNGEKLKSTTIKSIDKSLVAMLDFYKENKTITTVAMSQGGDWIGGSQSAMAKTNHKRKAMNSFLCSVNRPFQFYGRINEDVNFYTCEGRKGRMILTIAGLQLTQKQTQSNSGGMTDIYMDKGTYFKSFYSIMYSPSCVKIALMGNTKQTMRIHHRVTWNNCTPMILNETKKKP